MITVMEIRHVVSPLVTVVLFRNIGPKTREKYSREGTIESTLKKINNKWSSNKCNLLTIKWNNRPINTKLQKILESEKNNFYIFYQLILKICIACCTRWLRCIVITTIKGKNKHNYLHYKVSSASNFGKKK